MMGTGFDDFFAAVQEAISEYDTVYRPELEKTIEEKLARQADQKDSRLLSMLKQMKVADDDALGSNQDQQAGN